MIKTYVDYVERAKKTLKVACEMYEELSETSLILRGSDFVLERLDSLVCELSFGIVPVKYSYTVELICEWVKENV